MKLIIRNIIIKNVAFLLIGIMVIMIANQAVFTHFHLLSNGLVITHAHPYNKNSDKAPFKKHHHSSAEYVLLKQVRILFIGFTVSISFFLFSKKFSYIENLILSYSSGFSIVYTGRSPPCIL